MILPTALLLGALGYLFYTSKKESSLDYDSSLENLKENDDVYKDLEKLFGKSWGHKLDEWIYTFLHQNILFFKNYSRATWAPLKHKDYKGKDDMQVFFNADTDLQKLSAQLELANIRINFLKECMQNITWRHQTIKNTIDWRKFMAGS